MIEAQLRHAIPDHDPTGRESQTWPQRRPSQIVIRKDAHRILEVEVESALEDPEEHNLQHGATPRGLRLAEPNTVADGTRRSKDAIEEPYKSEDSQLHDEGLKRRTSRAGFPVREDTEKEKVLKLSPAKIQELTCSPDSLPLRVLPGHASPVSKPRSPELATRELSNFTLDSGDGSKHVRSRRTSNAGIPSGGIAPSLAIPETSSTAISSSTATSRPSMSSRAASTPAPGRNRHLKDDSRTGKPRNIPAPLRFDAPEDKASLAPSSLQEALPSPMPPSIPLPPLSLPTYLQLELASTRPSPLYIHRSVTSDFPYESSRVKIERLQNFLLLPPQLEQVLWFGALACLDAWLYTFTILPLRFFKALSILIQSWLLNIATEARFVASFVYEGSGRVWQRRRTRGASATDPALRDPFVDNSSQTKLRHGNSIRRPALTERASEPGRSVRAFRKHKRTKSVPSALLPDDKADILKGLLIIATCAVLMRLNASRVYHWIRQQAAIKLYVIYNVLEVGDRLFSALGQDVLECLFSREALERKPDGRSKVIRPFWLFLLALAYTVIHSTALFCQVITLNVAVNSYSNALVTLLMSNQFVEIKSTVFKKFEKENLFQLTCADVVERFQLWLMLIIIASRNIVETGSLSTGFSLFQLSLSAASASVTNASAAFPPPRSSASILPSAFELLPNLLSSVTAYAPSIGHVLAPFLVVLGSEMLVDWLKHAYINKFNNTRPAIYGRFLDVLAKDYYSHAFADQNLTKRLGLPVIPLSCLFIRAGVQTYHMFLAAWVPAPLPRSTTSLADLTSSASPRPTSTTAAISQHIDALFGQIPTSITASAAFRNLTTIIICVLAYVVLLALKLVLGMVLLSFARARYRSMKQREKAPIHQVEGGRRVGGWGVVEVDDDKKRWIYEDDPAALKAAREREARDKERQAKDPGGSAAFDKVKRYEMVGKRIW